MSPKSVGKLNYWVDGRPIPATSSLPSVCITRSYASPHGEGSEAEESLRTHPQRVDPSQMWDLSTDFNANLSLGVETDTVPLSVGSAVTVASHETDNKAMTSEASLNAKPTGSEDRALTLRYNILSGRDAVLPTEWYDDPELRIKIEGQHPKPIDSPKGFTRFDDYGFFTHYWLDAQPWDDGISRYSVMVYLDPSSCECEEQKKLAAAGKIPLTRCLCLGVASNSDLSSVCLEIMMQWSEGMNSFTVGGKIKEGLVAAFQQHWKGLSAEVAKKRRKNQEAIDRQEQLI